MRLRKLTTEFNVVAEIDELIMQLTYIKNGNSPSTDKLKKGLQLIELILSFSESTQEKNVEEKPGYSPFHEKLRSYSGNYNIAEYREELETAKESIKKFINHPKGSDKSNINSIQEMLLKISIPIWNEEITVLKSKQYKSIEI